MSATAAGWNFRNTSAYVTDGTDETYVLSEAYPVTRDIGGTNWTFGWTTTITGRANRDSTVDRRLAGINYTIPDVDGTGIFRIDLPATGNWDIRLAWGDQSFSHAFDVITLKDNLTTFLTLSHDQTTAKFWDPTDVEYTTAAWPGSNSALTRNFASTTFFFELTVSGGAGQANTIAHISVLQGAGAGGAAPRKWSMGRLGVQ